jgi:hypothetical protein
MDGDGESGDPQPSPFSERELRMFARFRKHEVEGRNFWVEAGHRTFEDFLVSRAITDRTQARRYAAWKAEVKSNDTKKVSVYRMAMLAESGKVRWPTGFTNLTDYLVKNNISAESYDRFKAAWKELGARKIEALGFEAALAERPSRK